MSSPPEEFDAKVACYNCDVVFREDLAAELEPDDLEQLEPNMLVPAGKCPQCQHLVFLTHGSTSVHVVWIDHRHGTNLYVGFTKEAAFQQLRAYVRRYWADINHPQSFEECKFPIDEYFEECDECYEVMSRQIDHITDEEFGSDIQNKFLSIAREV